MANLFFVDQKRNWWTVAPPIVGTDDDSIKLLDLFTGLSLMPSNVLAVAAVFDTPFLVSIKDTDSFQITAVSDSTVVDPSALSSKKQVLLFQQPK